MYLWKQLYSNSSLLLLFLIWKKEAKQYWSRYQNEITLVYIVLPHYPLNISCSLWHDCTNSWTPASEGFPWEGGRHKCTGQESVLVLSCLSTISTGKARLKLLIQKKKCILKVCFKFCFKYWVEEWVVGVWVGERGCVSVWFCLGLCFINIWNCLIFFFAIIAASVHKTLCTLVLFCLWVSKVLFW